MLIRIQFTNKLIFARRLLLAAMIVVFSGCTTPGADSSLLLETTTDKALLSYFKLDYLASRSDFRRLATELGHRMQGTQSGKFPFPSRKFQDLSIDWCYVPPTGEKGSLLLITSGLHGAEGPVGAAVQRHFMEKILPETDRSRTGFLFVHAVNPFGFHAFRRVTENNVDLNRNFDINGKLYETKNAGYAELNEFLNPTDPADPTDMKYFFFSTRSFYNIILKGVPALRQAILQGQYEYPQGVYFGGQRAEPQRKILESFLIEKFSGFKAVVAIDMHTGYGERGVLHLFPNAPRTTQIKQTTEFIFEGYRIDWGTDEDFYTVTGQFTDYLSTLVKEGVLFVPMVFEYGTLDNQTTGGSIESIRRTILENQGYHHGYADASSQKDTRADFYEMFYPSSPHWRTHIMRNTTELWKTVVPRLNKLGIKPN